MLTALYALVNNFSGGLTIFYENNGEEVMDDLAHCQNEEIKQMAQHFLEIAQNGEQIEIDQEESDAQFQTMYANQFEMKMDFDNFVNFKPHVETENIIETNV